MPNNTFAFSYPHSGECREQFLGSVVGMIFYEHSKPIEKRLLSSFIRIPGGCYVGMNRNFICKEFLTKYPESHLLMVDTDIEFEPKILDVLDNYITAVPEAHIIAGRVNLLNGMPVFYYMGPNGIRVHWTMPFLGLKKFDLVGTGIICISRACLLEMHKRKGNIHLFKHIEKVDREIGDDMTFCIRARKSGFDPYGCWEIKGIHYKTHPCPQNYPELSQVVMK